VVACSALRKVYRNIIREYDSSTYFVLLNGTEELIRSRVESRTHQFMSPALLSSQFALLEELGDDERGQSIDIACSIDHIVDAIVESVTPDCHNDSSS
jgi:gluconokinase